MTRRSFLIVGRGKMGKLGGVCVIVTATMHALFGHEGLGDHDFPAKEAGPKILVLSTIYFFVLVH